MSKVPQNVLMASTNILVGVYNLDLTPDCNIAAVVFDWLTLLSQASYVTEWFYSLKCPLHK